MGAILIMNKYLSDIRKSMKILSKHKNSIFIGQSVKFPGSSIYTSLKNVPKSKRIELPVFEDTQMGMSIGLALEGFLPITCFPRFDFLILALNQLVNHADKIDMLTNSKFKSKIIIRTMVGAKKPLDGGPQHTQDHTIAIKKMLKYSYVKKLDKKSNILNEYNKAIKSKNYKVFVFIEDGKLYL